MFLGRQQTNIAGFFRPSAHGGSFFARLKNGGGGVRRGRLRGPDHIRQQILLALDRRGPSSVRRLGRLTGVDPEFLVEEILKLGGQVIFKVERRVGKRLLFAPKPRLWVTLKGGAENRGRRGRDPAMMMLFAVRCRYFPLPTPSGRRPSGHSPSCRPHAPTVSAAPSVHGGGRR